MLPAPYPNLLVNGSAGIAVGMATNIPPHNLREVIEGIVWLTEHADESREAKERTLLSLVPGPDFPTGGFIVGGSGIAQAHRTGRGSITMRARTTIEPTKKGDRVAIIVSEIPYQLNKARLLEKIAQLARDKVIEGISDLRDESDREGMRIVIELRRGEVPEVVLNNLYKHTSLQTSFGIIMLAIVAGGPASSPSWTSSSTSSSSGGRSCGDGPSLSYGRPRPERISSRGSKLRLTTSTPSSHWSEAPRRRLRRALG